MHPLERARISISIVRVEGKLERHMRTAIEGHVPPVVAWGPSAIDHRQETQPLPAYELETPAYLWEWTGIYRWAGQWVS